MTPQPQDPDPGEPTRPALGAGRSSGFDARFDELAALAYRVAFRIVGQREEARDIAQEALARAYSRWPRVEARASGWVSRVATNLALDHVRRRQRRRDRLPPPARSGEPSGSAAERADLVAALRRLPRRQRDVVVLRYLADLSEADVAATLGCQPGTVKSHAARGLAALRASLSPVQIGDETGLAVPPATAHAPAVPARGAH